MSFQQLKSLEATTLADGTPLESLQSQCLVPAPAEREIIMACTLFPGRVLNGHGQLS